MFPEDEDIDQTEEPQENWEPPKDSIPQDVEELLDIVDKDGNLVDDEDAGGRVADDDDDDKPARPPRNQRRIDQLTARHRDEERRRESAENENAQLRDRLGRIENNQDQSRIDNFAAEYADVKEQLTKATEEGATKLQVDLTEKMADMRAAARVADSQRAARERQQPQQQPQSRQQPPQNPARPQQEGGDQPPPEEAMTWWNKNRWFNTKEHAAESAYARSVDQTLDTDGWDKNDPSYYTELDNRLQKRFPELYDKPSKPKPPISSSRGRGSKGAQQPSKDGRIRLTKERLDMARSLGITSAEDLRSYAAECARLENQS